MRLKLTGFDLSAIDCGEITDHIDVRSPIKGIVDKVYVNLGNLATVNHELFNVICKEQLHIEIMVFEKDIQFVQTGQRVTFELSNFSNEVHESRIFSIGSTLDKLSRSIPVFAEFNNVTDKIYPGMFLAATIHTGEGIFDALPITAIISERQDEHYIFYTQEGSDKDLKTTFRKVRVNTGLKEDDHIQVTLSDSLPDNAMIVTEGGYYLRAEMLKSME